MKRLIILISFIFFLAGNGLAAGGNELTDTKDKVSYSIGYQVGGDLKRQDIEIRAAMLVQGIQDALAKSQPQMAMDEMLASLMELKRRTESRQGSSQNPENSNQGKPAQ